jgi:hypothetical protein
MSDHTWTPTTPDVKQRGEARESIRRDPLLHCEFRSDVEQSRRYPRVCVAGERHYLHGLFADAWHGPRPDGLLSAHELWSVSGRPGKGNQS